MAWDPYHFYPQVWIIVRHAVHAVENVSDNHLPGLSSWMVDCPQCGLAICKYAVHAAFMGVLYLLNCQVQRCELCRIYIKLCHITENGCATISTSSSIYSGLLPSEIKSSAPTIIPSLT